MLDKMKGGLVGFAIGDAMGVATEFMTQEEIKAKFGVVTEILGGGAFHFQRGETSDDTAMTIAVAKGIIANSREPLEDMGKQFLRWRDTNPKDIGITVSSAFYHYQGDWFQAAKAAHAVLGQSGGNGTLMRCLPIAFAYSDPAKIEQWSKLQSKMTHLEDSASEGCIIYNRIATRLLQGEDIKTSILEEISGTIYDIDYSQEPDCPPNGYVVHTLKWVFFWLLNRNTFDEVIIGAVNMGNDSDTIAAIAGGLKGIEVGFNCLPYHFKRRIVKVRVLEEIAETLFLIRDKDTLKIKENSGEYLKKIAGITDEFIQIAALKKRIEQAEKLEQLNQSIYLYRVSISDEDDAHQKKYENWHNVRIRFIRSRRLIDLGAPPIIIENEMNWLKTEVNHLNQLHLGLQPQYTEEELEDLRQLAETERMFDEEDE